MTRNLKDPLLCSGHGFLPVVEMTENMYYSRVLRIPFFRDLIYGVRCCVNMLITLL